MSSGLDSVPAGLRQVWAAARLDLMRLGRGRYRRATAVLVGLPVIASLIVAAALIHLAERPFHEVLVVGSSSRSSLQTLTQAVQVLWPLSLRFCVFLAAIDIFGGLFRAELSERTLHHVFLQPLRRETVTMGKYLAGLILLARLGAVAWVLSLVAWLVPHGPSALIGTLFSSHGLELLGSYLLALVLALSAYGGIFLLAGMLARGPVVVGATLWLWESVAVFLPAWFQRFTVAHWLSSLRTVESLGEKNTLLAAIRQEADPSPVWLCILVCLAIGFTTTAVATWWSRHLELDYGKQD